MILGRLGAEAERCVLLSPTRGLMAGFPIADRHLPTAEARAPAFLTKTKQGLSTWAAGPCHLKASGNLSSILPASHPLRRAV